MSIQELSKSLIEASKTIISRKEDKDYDEFFRAAMKKFGIKSPSELDGDKEKEFYDYIDKNWKGEKSEANEEKNVSLDARYKAFKERAAKLGYIKNETKKQTEKESVCEDCGCETCECNEKDVKEYINQDGTRRRVKEGDKRRTENSVKQKSSKEIEEELDDLNATVMKILSKNAQEAKEKKVDELNNEEE